MCDSAFESLVCESVLSRQLHNICSFIRRLFELSRREPFGTRVRYVDHNSDPREHEKRDMREINDRKVISEFRNIS